MLKRIQASIVTRLAPVKELLRLDRDFVRGLPVPDRQIIQDDAGDVGVFIKGGNIREIKIEVTVQLPSCVKSSIDCFPAVEQVWGLLHLFRPDSAAGALANMQWELTISNSRWSAEFNYTLAISPYVFEFPDKPSDVENTVETLIAP